MTEEVKEEYQYWEKDEEVNPLITTKLAYVENLQQEIQNLQEQRASLQYQLDIRVTALTMYQSTLEIKEESKANGEDKTPMEKANEMAEKAELDESNS